MKKLLRIALAFSFAFGVGFAAPVSVLDEPTVSVAYAADYYMLNTKSGKFHYPTCRTIKHPEAAHWATASTREEAINAGYVPCGVCHP